MKRFISCASMVALFVVLVQIAAGQLAAYNWVSGIGSNCVQMVQDPNDPNTKYVVRQTGRIEVIQNGSVLPTPYLDLSGLIYVPGPPPDSLGERGVLGMEFAPDYATSGHVYINY